MISLADDYERLGFAIVPQCLPADTVRQLSNWVELARRNESAKEAVANRSGVYAMRNLTDAIPEVTSLLSCLPLIDIVRQILQADAFLTRATLFDKTSGANWGVFWHQDLSIAVKERHDVDGFSAWTFKAGVHSVQPPLDTMRRILAVRLHLDDCTVSNGALRVIPGTHQSGQSNSDAPERVAGQHSEVICEVPSGGAVLMNPLLLHASSPMKVAGHRRVIHFEFADFDLPAPLDWKYQLPISSG